MKSKPNAVLLLAALLIAVASATAGWMARGMFTQRTTTSQATAPPPAEISRAGSSSAASLTSQHSGGVSAEEPKAMAKRVLQAVIEGTQEAGSETLLKFRFRQALAGCDEAAVADMLESLMRYANDQRDHGLYTASLPVQLTDLVMAQMAALNPQKALDFQLGLAQAGMPTTSRSFSMVMALLAEQNAPDVQNVIESLPPGDTRIWAQIAWWDARSKSDPEGVFQSLMNLDSDTRNSLFPNSRALAELFEKLALQAPEKALQAAALFPDDSMNKLKADLVANWIKRDPTAAVQWAWEQHDAKSLMMCLRALPSDNRALVEKSIRDNFSSITSTEHAVRVSLAHDLAAHLAAQDIPEALRWVATLPAAEQTAANVPVVEAWMRKDADAAAEWLTTWPAGKSRDEAVGRLVESIRTDDPEGALTWAASIQARNRYSLMQKALDTLSEKDPAAAERAKQALSEEDQAVLSVIKRHGFGE